MSYQNFSLPPSQPLNNTNITPTDTTHEKATQEETSSTSPVLGHMGANSVTPTSDIGDTKGVEVRLLEPKNQEPSPSIKGRFTRTINTLNRKATNITEKSKKLLNTVFTKYPDFPAPAPTRPTSPPPPIPARAPPLPSTPPPPLPPSSAAPDIPTTPPPIPATPPPLPSTPPPPLPPSSDAPDIPAMPPPPPPSSAAPDIPSTPPPPPSSNAPPIPSSEAPPIPTSDAPPIPTSAAPPAPPDIPATPPPPPPPSSDAPPIPTIAPPPSPKTPDLPAMPPPPLPARAKVENHRLNILNEVAVTERNFQASVDRLIILSKFMKENKEVFKSQADAQSKLESIIENLSEISKASEQLAESFENTNLTPDNKLGIYMTEIYHSYANALGKHQEEGDKLSKLLAEFEKNIPQKSDLKKQFDFFKEGDSLTFGNHISGLTARLPRHEMFLNDLTKTNEAIGKLEIAKNQNRAEEAQRKRAERGGKLNNPNTPQRNQNRYVTLRPQGNVQTEINQVFIDHGKERTLIGIQRFNLAKDLNSLDPQITASKKFIQFALSQAKSQVLIDKLKTHQQLIKDMEDNKQTLQKFLEGYDEKPDEAAHNAHKAYKEFLKSDQILVDFENEFQTKSQGFMNKMLLSKQLQQYEKIKQEYLESWSDFTGNSIKSYEKKVDEKKVDE